MLLVFHHKIMCHQYLNSFAQSQNVEKKIAGGPVLSLLLSCYHQQMASQSCRANCE